MKIDVLDKGYVRLLDVLGDDKTVVNAARVSYDKEVKEMSGKDESLICFLAENEHTSPFRHPKLSFEVYAPLFVARQWWKYVVDSSHIEEGACWNESSRRYVTEEPEFYIPEIDEWRSAPDNSKQGSGEFLPKVIGNTATKELINYIKQGVDLYHYAMEGGNICAEQARLFLPAYGMYVRWRWTASLHTVVHFLKQRLNHDAQKEIQDYAKAVEDMVVESFPVSASELLK